MKAYCSICKQIQLITADLGQYEEGESDVYPVVLCLECKANMEERLTDYFFDHS